MHRLVSVLAAGTSRTDPHEMHLICKGALFGLGLNIRPHRHVMERTFSRSPRSTDSAEGTNVTLHRGQATGRPINGPLIVSLALHLGHAQATFWVPSPGPPTFAGCPPVAAGKPFRR